MRLLLITLAILFTGCPGEGSDFVKIKLINQSNSRINFGVTFYKPNSGIEYYPVSEPIDKELIDLNSGHDIILEMNNHDTSGEVHLFIYKKETLDEHGWQEVRDKRLYDKRYDLTLDDLRAMNWTIVYTGK